MCRIASARHQKRDLKRSFFFFVSSASASVSAGTGAGSAASATVGAGRRPFTRCSSAVTWALKAAAASAEDARRPRYTPEQLRQLCSAVIDSIQTDRLTPDAILELAKKDFNGTETITEGWAALSGQAVASLTELLEKLDAQDITPDRLDELARIESNVLIEYSVTRSIKAILLRWLSQASNDRMICQHFEKDEEMTGL